jgi:parallel beta-helix repeat protein
MRCARFCYRPFPTAWRASALCAVRVQSRFSLATALFIALASGTAHAQGTATAARPVIELRRGMVITRSIRFARKTYRIAAPATLDPAVLVVRGHGITIDFNGATLRGTDPRADPDRRTGVALLVDGGSDVHIVNARIHGFKVGILARGTQRLEIADADLSHNWKPRLFSLVEHESLVDWLSFHHNEKDEWLRFGAAIYLSDVKGGAVRRTVAEQGMNGLLMVRTDSVRVEDNTFSFNSGLGVGLYRSSDNVIVHNRIDYNVRGYSHGFYRRGQDSAGILLYEQSSGNLIAFNSATHGGDGFFLWAGQSTMDTGEGGANDNLVFLNDFSFAPANGIEATFSRNAFLANALEGNEYGLWGGYSFDSWIGFNCFMQNRTGIAIEHGQNNVIETNVFRGDSTAIRLWADTIQPSDWAYPKKRDTQSRDYDIRDNVFIANRVRLTSSNTTSLRAVDNDSTSNPSSMATGSCMPSTLRQRIGGRRPPIAFPRLMEALSAMSRFDSLPARAYPRRDRSAIVVDDWGPYDWRSPKLWPVDSTHAQPLRLVVRGPEGRWRTISRRGIVSLSRSSGRTGDTIAVVPRADASGDWALTLEYVGAATVSPLGEQRAAGRPYRFAYGRFEPRIDWTVRFFAWSDTTDPRSRPDAFAALLNSRPLLETRTTRVDYLWYRPTLPEVPQQRFALEAQGRLTLAPGEYTLQTISDDGVRVWVDGALVIDNWSLHESALNDAVLRGGAHDVRVQFFQVDGWTELRLDILRGRRRPAASPGPH